MPLPHGPWASQSPSVSQSPDPNRMGFMVAPLRTRLCSDYERLRPSIANSRRRGCGRFRVDMAKGFSSPSLFAFGFVLVSFQCFYRERSSKLHLAVAFARRRTRAAAQRRRRSRSAVRRKSTLTEFGEAYVREASGFPQEEQALRIEEEVAERIQQRAGLPRVQQPKLQGSSAHLP